MALNPKERRTEAQKSAARRNLVKARAARRGARRFRGYKPAAAVSGFAPAGGIPFRHSVPGYRKVIAEFRDYCSKVPNSDGTKGAPCWRCTFDDPTIDYSLKPRHGEYIPDAFEADHFYSVKTHPHLMADPSNLRPAHAECNRKRGAEDLSKTGWARAADW